MPTQPRNPKVARAAIRTVLNQLDDNVLANIIAAYKASPDDVETLIAIGWRSKNPFDPFPADAFHAYMKELAYE